MAISWPGRAEFARNAAVVALESARESATKARAVVDPERREFVAECRDMLAQAALAVRSGRLVNLGHADRWSPGVRERVDLAEQTIRYARERVRLLDGGQADLAGALLAEIAALCSDAIWYLTAA